MSRNYCSLADGKYLPQLLALYESLEKHSSEPFTLWVLALDDVVWRVLREGTPLPHMQVHWLENVEAEMGLRTIRLSRTWQEYCWLLASNYCEFLMTSGLPEVSYCDADVYFFDNPSVIFDRIGDRAIGITPHYFPDQYKYLERNGKYCVSICHFKNNPVGRECLSRWASDCRAWCFYRNEGDLFADQKYLDRFKADFGDEVAEIDRDAAWAPWNLSEYDGRPIRAYHFHEFRQREDGTFQLTNYPVNTKAFMDIYSPYIYAVTAAKERIAAVQSVAG